MGLYVEFVVVGGGGGGGGSIAEQNWGGGGGGGGGILQSAIDAPWSTACSVVIGAGGAGGIGNSGGNGMGKNGGDTAVYNITNWAYGGGGGGGADREFQTAKAGLSGGNGGGGANAAGGNPTQGYKGGIGLSNCSGGGGGMTQAGANGSQGTGGKGGDGLANYFTGGVVYGGGGGGGGDGSEPSGIGGNYAGGKGGILQQNGGGGGYYGAGGGGAGVRANLNGGAGYQGIAVLRYAGPQICTGGVVSSYGGYTVHTFTASGTFTTPAAPVVPRIDNLDAFTYRQGTVNLYSHVYGAGLVSGTYGVFTPATGCSAPFAAHGGDSLIALYFNIAADAPLGTRQFQVQNPNGTSNAVTVTIIPPLPMLTSIVGFGGWGAQAFLGVKTRLNLNGTNFIAGATVSGPGLTFSNVVVASATLITCDVVASGLGDQPVTVTTGGGTTGAVNLTVFAAVANTGINPGMIINLLNGTPVNQVTGQVGFYFTVGASDRRVTALGRWKWGTNTGKHVITLLDSAYQVVTRAIVDLSTGPMDAFVYSTLPQPVLLKAGQAHLLLSDEIFSGDYFTNPSSVLTDGKATVGGLNQFHSVIQQVTSLGSTRTDGPYWLGFKFTALAGYGLMGLGRWKRPGDSQAHQIILKDSAGTIIRTGTVDFTGGKGADNQFNYVSVPYGVMTAGAVYYVETVEYPGGDPWPSGAGDATVVNFGITMHGRCAEAGSTPVNGIPTEGSTGTTYALPTVLFHTYGWSGEVEAFGVPNLQWQAAGQPMAMII
jgi:hypothetical protein